MSVRFAIVIGCSALAANASPSLKATVAVCTDSFTWVDKAISDFLGVLTIGEKINTAKRNT
jgi:hypothetical protein